MFADKLMVFVKNEIAGKTKTRLGATIGDEEALRVYRKLLRHTYEVTNTIQAEKEVWYSDYIETQDVWPQGSYQKKVQKGSDLGERMSHAFEEAFKENEQRKVVIIGSDCAELTGPVLKEAFEMLNEADFVIGPAKDGGYYLLGMRTFEPKLFEDIAWSTDSVFGETLRKIRDTGLNFAALKPLNDVDTIDDWQLVKDRLN